MANPIYKPGAAAAAFGYNDPANQSAAVAGQNAHGGTGDYSQFGLDKVAHNKLLYQSQQQQQPPGEGYGPGFGETYGKEHVGQYEAPSMFEQFAQQQMNGNNPYYDRLRQQGMASLNQQMAARGHYNSGGALSSLGNYSGALDAAQFKDMGDLLSGASQAQLARQGQGQSVANSVQSQQQQRMGQQFGSLSDLAHLGAGNVGGFFGQGGQQSGDAAMAGINAGVDAAAKQGQGQNAFTNEMWGLGGTLFGGKGGK